jgi:hypothetical protein
MALTTFPAPSAGKIAFKTSLTSGTSWTVPTGVTSVNVTLIGGGGGSGAVVVGQNTGVGDGGAGGTTSFTGATSALGGNGSIRGRGKDGSGQENGTGYIAAASVNNTGKGALGGYATNIGIGSAFPGLGISPKAGDGQIITSNLSTTPGASIAYAIGAGGTAGVNTNGNAAGRAGGSGRIDIEYWA